MLKKYGGINQSNEKCILKGCYSKQKAAGYCKRHLNILKKHKIVVASDKIRKYCVVEGCTKDPILGNVCYKHLNQIRKLGRVVE
jgi:hypothetical protein